MRGSASQAREKRDRGGGSGSPLGMLREFAVKGKSVDLSSPEGRLKLRWRLAWAQREAIFKAGLAKDFKTLINCHAVPVPKFSRKKDGTFSATGSPGCVEAHYYGQSDERPVGYAWLRKDGNPLLCFVCAPKVRYYRAQEVMAACLSMMEKDYGWFFLTFTAPHDLNTDPGKQVELFNKAMQLFKSGNRYNGHKWEYFKEQYGFEHQINARELTDDSPLSVNKSGCHWHVHALAFYSRMTFISNAASLRRLRKEMAIRWVRCLMAVGLCTEKKKKDALRHAFLLEVPREPKTPIEDAEKAAMYVAKGAACEMSPGIFTKNGRFPARISHWEIMALAFSGRFPQLVPRALAIMKALKGRHWLDWTDGLKKLCGIGEVTDEEIMQEKKSLPVYQFKAESWQKVDRQKWQVNLLNASIRDLKKQGFDCSLPPQDLDDAQIKVIHDVFEDNMKKIGFGVDPEKMEFYSVKILDQDPVSVREYLVNLIDRNLRRFGREFAPLRC